MNKVAAILSVWCLGMAATVAPAQEFPVFGARNLALGRAGVASVIDLSAVFLNPAALARNDSFKITLPTVGAAVFSPIDVDQTQEIIDNITTVDLSNPGQAAQTVVREIRRLGDDLVVSGEAHGLIGVRPAEKFALTYSERVIGDVRIDVDTTNLNTSVGPPLPPDSVLFNTTNARGQVLWLRQLGLSFATPLPVFHENLLVGATALGGHATTYHEQIFVVREALAGTGTIDWQDRLFRNQETSFFLDLVLGAQLMLLDRRLTLGATATQLLSPRLRRHNQSDLELDPQARLGIAYSPFYREPHAGPARPEQEPGLERPRPPSESQAGTNPLTLTLDYDLSENDSSLARGLKSRYLGGGFEYAPRRWLALRGGIYANLSEPKLGQTFTAGLQVSFVEIAAALSNRRTGGYPSDARAEISFSLTF